MALDRAEVRRIAALARLELTPEEEERLVEELGRIVTYFDRLSAVEVPDPPPAERSEALVEADDRPAPCLPREHFLRNAPHHRQGFLVVPRIRIG